MAPRYLIAAADRCDLPVNLVRQLLSMTGLLTIVKSERLIVCCLPEDQPVILANGAGAIIGHLFSRSSHFKRITELDASETTLISRSGGNHLLNTCWGGYVAATIDPQSGCVTVMRDPSGTVPCIWTERDGYSFMASDIDMLCQVSENRPSVNWPALFETLVSTGLPASSTCLNGVTELLAGNAMVFEPTGHHVRTAWTPWDYVRYRRPPDDRALADELRAALMGCIGAWGKSFKHILLGVSGGLDSSIVAAALSAAGVRFTAFTMCTGDPVGDERQHARCLARSLDCELLEFQHTHDDIDVTWSASCFGVRPGMSAYGQSNLRNQKALAADRNIDAFFSGIGGDNVFCLTQSATPLVDRIELEGGCPELLHTLTDICQITGASLIDVLRLATRTMCTPKASYPWPFDPSFLNRDLFNEAAPKLAHPWLRHPGSVPRGKAVHIARLMVMQVYSEIFPRRDFGPMILPLLSQPIVELCLSIQTWMWVAGGQNRSVARQAFSDLLPPEIIHRRTKGGPDNFACEVVERNKPRIRDFLLSGCLAERGMVDRTALETCLSDMSVVRASDHARISQLAEAEAWGRHWAAGGIKE